MTSQQEIRAMCTTIHVNVLRLICIPSKAEMVSEVSDRGINTSVKAGDKFLTVFSICMIPTGRNTALIVCINNESVIP